MAFGFVEAVFVIGADVDEAGFLEGFELQGDGAEGDVGHGAVDVAGAALFAPDEAEDLAAAGGGDCFKERGVHELHFSFN